VGQHSLQSAAPTLLGVICTRIFAPVSFGRREPDERPARRPLT
jgi:hypothetical protein